MPAPIAFTVRPARPDDLDTLVAFSTAMALETEGRRLDRSRLRRGIEAVLGSPDKGLYYVCEAAGPATIIVGQLMVTYEWSDWRNAAFWWIQSVYVDPGWRRRGVYRRLHEQVIEDAERRPDVCGIRLYVEAENRGAQTAYERVGLSPSTYRVYERDFVLTKHSSGGPDASASGKDRHDARPR